MSLIVSVKLSLVVLHCRTRFYRGTAAYKFIRKNYLTSITFFLLAICCLKTVRAEQQKSEHGHIFCIAEICSDILHIFRKTPYNRQHKLHDRSHYRPVRLGAAMIGSQADISGIVGRQDAHDNDAVRRLCCKDSQEQYCERAGTPWRRLVRILINPKGLQQTFLCRSANR